MSPVSSSTPGGAVNDEANTAETAATDEAPATPDETGTDDIAKQLEGERAKNERLLADVHKHRTRAEAVEAAQKAAEEERLKAAPLEERLNVLEQERDELAKRATTAELTAKIAGKIIDPDAAIRLWQDRDTIDTFLERHPYMAPTVR